MENYNNSDELTLKELILQIQEYYREVVKNWKLVGFVCLLSVSAFLYKHYNFENTYNTKLDFVVEGQSQGGGLSRLLGSFGIKKGGKVNPYKILEVGRSMSLCKNVLNTNLSNDIILANELIQAYGLVDKWSNENLEYKNFKFTLKSFSPSASRIEKKAIKNLFRLIWGNEKNQKNAFVVFNLNDETGIYTINTSVKTETLSIEMTKIIYKEIKLFFEEKIFQNQMQSTQILANKTDSLRTVRNIRIRELARFEDNNRNLISKSSLVKRSILNKEITALNIAYAEVMKNYEMTDVNLKDIQPLFMAIDVPTEPLIISKSSVLKNIIFGVIMGLFIAVLLVISRKIYKSVMNS